jgi:hypothetical protein
VNSGSHLLETNSHLPESSSHQVKHFSHLTLSNIFKNPQKFSKIRKNPSKTLQKTFKNPCSFRSVFCSRLLSSRFFSVPSMLFWFRCSVFVQVSYRSFYVLLVWIFRFRILENVHGVVCDITLLLTIDFCDYWLLSHSLIFGLLSLFTHFLNISDKGGLARKHLPISKLELIMQRLKKLSSKKRKKNLKLLFLLYF